MRKQSLAAALAAATVLSFAACDDDVLDPDDDFEATLTGGAEVPSVDTDATGTATFEFDDGVMAFDLDVAGLTGATAAHIHGPADAGENADVIVGLFAGPAGGTGTINGDLASGTFTVSDFNTATISMDSLLVLMNNGNAYVNVHTVDHPGGEIRGQIRND